MLFFYYYHGNYPLKCNAFIVVEICFLSQLSHRNLKTDSQTQIPMFKRNPKDKTKTQKKAKPPKQNQNTPTTTLPPKKPQNTKPPTHWYLYDTHTKAELFRLERTAGGRSLKEQMDRTLLKEGTVMQKSMIWFNHLIACSCAVKHKIHLHCTNMNIQDSCTLPQVLWKREWGWDEPLVVRNSHVGNSGEHVREE